MSKETYVIVKYPSSDELEQGCAAILYFSKLISPLFSCRKELATQYRSRNEAKNDLDYARKYGSSTKGRLEILPNSSVVNEKTTKPEIQEEYEYGGFARNLESESYDLMFQTPNSAFLCERRVLEKIKNEENAYGKKIHDERDIYIARRRVIITKDGWEKEWMEKK